MYNKLLIIDGSYYLNRCLSIPRFFDMINQNNVHIGGVYGFFNTLATDIKKHPDYFPVVVFDSGLNQRRVELYPDYKNNISRQLAESIELSADAQFNNFGIQYKLQRDILAQIFPYMGIPTIIIKDYEGDDLIYILSRLTDSCIISTEDRDMWQLVSEHCKIYLPKQKKYIDYNYVQENYNGTKDFILRKVILGDKSDNIKSCCKGIGEKSVNDFITLIKLFNNSLLGDTYDFKEYPSTEARMKNLCLAHNIPYKKAYLNFDENIFLINLELIALNKLNIDNNIENIIIDNISNCRTNIRMIQLQAILTKLGVYKMISSDIDQIVPCVSKSYLNLYKI